MPNVDDIISNFEILDEVDDRYRYLIELGRELSPLPGEAHNEANRVRGCASQVWLETATEPNGVDPVMRFRGDSDAHIVKGLIYLALALYDGRPASAVAGTDATPLFSKLGLGGHITRQRSNGFAAMVERIRADAGGRLGALKRRVSGAGAAGRGPSPSRAASGPWRSSAPPSDSRR